MSIFSVFLAGLGLILIYMSLIWLVSVLLKDASIVDIFWGLGFVLLNSFYLSQSKTTNPQQILLTLLLTIWGLRLSGHIFWRNKGHGEDFRYQQWRESAGNHYWWKSFFTVFLLQGFILWLVSAPLWATHSSNNQQPIHLTVIDFLALSLWSVGFFFEAVGDWQLAHFKANPVNRGQVLNTGLWQYTRHPNYFGDAVCWWAYWLFTLNSRMGWLTVFSPLLMTLLLMRVSGVTLLEKNLRKTKPAYQSYIAQTSAFFPWFKNNRQK